MKIWQFRTLSAAVVVIAGCLVTFIPDNPHDGLIGLLIGVLATLIVSITFVVYVINSEDR